MNIVVVGNGPKALSQRLGRWIDQQPVVARINCFQTEGFEDYIGSKTDIWVVNTQPNVRDRISHYPPSGDYKILHVHNNSSDHSRELTETTIREAGYVYTQVPQALVDRHREMNTGPDGRSFWMTAGVSALAYFCMTGQYNPVIAVGFNILDPVHTTTTGHYWGEGGGAGIHNHELERKALEQFFTPRMPEGQLMEVTGIAAGAVDLKRLYPSSSAVWMVRTVT